MYKNILLTLDASAADRPIIDHIKQLASLLHSRVILLHVANGPPVQMHGANAAGEEIEKSRAYLERVAAEFQSANVAVEPQLGFGDPVKEIIKYVNEKACELVAMGTHGHKLLGDLFLGVTASKVQHNISVPVLLLRAR